MEHISTIITRVMEEAKKKEEEAKKEKKRKRWEEEIQADLDRDFARENPEEAWRVGLEREYGSK